MRSSTVRRPQITNHKHRHEPEKKEDSMNENHFIAGFDTGTRKTELIIDLSGLEPYLDRQEARVQVGRNLNEYRYSWE
jgi:hypothetical protein